MEQCVQSQQDFHGTWLETCRHWPKAEKHLTICCLSFHVHVLKTGNTNPQTALNYHKLLLLYLNQTCPWNSPWCIGLGLITGTSRAHFKATLINVHLEMSWLLFFSHYYNIILAATKHLDLKSSIHPCKCFLASCYYSWFLIASTSQWLVPMHNRCYKAAGLCCST